MLRFAVRRLLLLVPILIGLSLLVFLWIRALPGSPAESLLGERATEESIAQIRDQYGLDDPFYEQYWRYLQTIGSRRPRDEHRVASSDHRGDRGAVPGDGRARVRRDAVRDADRDPARLHRGQASRQRDRPREPLPLADRRLDPDLLPRARPQVGLLGGARLAAEHRPPGRAHRRGAPDELLRPRRDHHAATGRRPGTRSST